MGKVSATTGEEGDATPFTNTTVESISELLHGVGYQRRGNEVMYNGHTGTYHPRIIYTFGPISLSLPFTRSQVGSTVLHWAHLLPETEAHG